MTRLVHAGLTPGTEADSSGLQRAVQSCVLRDRVAEWRPNRVGAPAGDEGGPPRDTERDDHGGRRGELPGTHGGPPEAGPRGIRGRNADRNGDRGEGVRRGDGPGGRGRRHRGAGGGDNRDPESAAGPGLRPRPTSRVRNAPYGGQVSNFQNSRPIAIPRAAPPRMSV